MPRLKKAYSLGLRFANLWLIRILKWQWMGMSYQHGMHSKKYLMEYWESSKRAISSIYWMTWLEDTEILAALSLKLHFFHSHLSFFLENAEDVSDEHGKRLHQDIATMENRYEWKWSPAVLVDFCWNLKLDQPKTFYKRISKYWNLERKFCNV